jgi:hypoxanthine phosphoribosyltransferase
MPVFTPIPHEQFVADVLALADALRADPDWRPDYLIGIGRGGLIPAVYLSHAIVGPMLSVAPALARLAERTREGARLLFIDDINDSGATIGRLRAGLSSAGAEAAHIRFATLLDNITSQQRVDYAARTIDRSVTKDWFIFPWEAVAPDAAIEADAAELPDRIA